MSKRWKAIAGAVDKKKAYSLPEAIEAVKKTATAKFPESVDVAMSLNVDPKKGDQAVRGTVLLPHGTGRNLRVIVFVKGEKEKDAREAGAVEVGAEDLIEKVTKGWTDFDVAIATPDMMKDVGKLGRVLGPKGLLPNPKSGTVTMDVAKAVKEFQKGRLEYRADAGGVVHGMVGKVTFTSDQLVENAQSFIEAVMKAKPSTVKGEYLKGVALSSTMGPGVHLDHREISKSASVGGS
jgi:large subunit ribosomal protein L1